MQRLPFEWDFDFKGREYVFSIGNTSHGDLAIQKQESIESISPGERPLCERIYLHHNQRPLLIGNILAYIHRQRIKSKFSGLKGFEDLLQEMSLKDPGIIVRMSGLPECNGSGSPVDMARRAFYAFNNPRIISGVLGANNAGIYQVNMSSHEEMVFAGADKNNEVIDAKVLTIPATEIDNFIEGLYMQSKETSIVCLRSLNDVVNYRFSPEFDEFISKFDSFYRKNTP